MAGFAPDPDGSDDDLDVANERLAGCRDDLEALLDNPEVENYAAGDYVEEAIDSLNAAIADIEQARRELDEARNGDEVR